MAEVEAPVSLQALAARVRIKADRRLGRDTDPVIEQIANAETDADPVRASSEQHARETHPQRPAADDS